jgi:hypothetical protein
LFAPTDRRRNQKPHRVYRRVQALVLIVVIPHDIPFHVVWHPGAVSVPTPVFAPLQLAAGVIAFFPPEVSVVDQGA